MKNMPSVMKHNFSEVPSANIERSSFDRTHGYKTTFDSGYLIPFYVDEALPGDSFNVNATIFARMTTPIVPIMDNLYLDTFYFAVPLRLVWENFQRFCGEQKNPGDSIDFLIPQIVSPVGGWQNGTLSDYFGLPTLKSGLSVSSLWHRAYNLIWNQWFRDQNLQPSIAVPVDDGPDNDASYVLQKRGKRHDYFTSCLPWPQKGPGVELPLGTTAPILGLAFAVGTDFGYTKGAWEQSGNAPVDGLDAWAASAGDGDTMRLQGTAAGSAGIPNVRADLSNASAATINSLRQAFQIQKLLERDARGGTRFPELIKSHFGVTSPDARVQRPEFLGGATSPIIIAPVQQTSGTGAYTPTPQGNLAAFGTVSSHREGFTKSFVEHSLIIGLLMVRADLTYQTGIPKMFSRRTRYDFYWPAFAHLGEQAVLNKEIYAQGNASDDLVFGYQERWAEYRYYPSKITGKLRSNDLQSLDVWHLSQEFSTLPTLSAAFIEENPPINRIVAVTSEPQFVLDSYIQCRTARPMPVYSVPGYIDHF